MTGTSGGDVEALRREHHRWWRILRRWTGPALRLLTVAAVIEFALLPQLAGARRSLHLLGEISPPWLVVGVLAEGLSLLAYARLTQVTLDVPEVPYAGVGSFLHVRNEPAVATAAMRSVRRIPKVDPQSVGRLLATLASTLRRLVADPAFLRRSAGWAAANWLLDASSLWAFVRAFDHSLGLVGLLVAYGLANVAAALPITPGGLGVVEGVLVPTLVAFGTPADIAVLAVVAYRLVSFWVPIPVGFRELCAAVLSDPAYARR